MNFEAQINRMIQTQLIDRGVQDPRVLDAIKRTPRHLFVPQELWNEAYEDKPLQLPEELATISQPYMVAYMSEALRCDSKCKLLEVGTGSGYQAAVLACLCKEVYTIERHYTLTLSANRTLTSLGRNNIHCKTGDGFEGWPEKAPFQRVILTAASQEIPPALIDQLDEGGYLLIPLGNSRMQTLTRIQKKDGALWKEPLISCVFVPMISQSRDLTRSGGPESPQPEGGR